MKEADVQNPSDHENAYEPIGLRLDDQTSVLQ